MTTISKYIHSKSKNTFPTKGWVFESQGERGEGSTVTSDWIRSQAAWVLHFAVGWWYLFFYWLLGREPIRGGLWSHGRFVICLFNSSKTPGIGVCGWNKPGTPDEQNNEKRLFNV